MRNVLKAIFKPLSLAASLLIVGLLVSACAGSVETRATNALAAACDGYATVLDQLTPLRAEGKLSESQVARVDAVNRLVDPLCLPGAAVDPTTAVTTVRNGIASLTAIKEIL